MAETCRKTRILIVDDHDVVRKGLCAVIKTHADWEICGEASNGREAVLLAKQTRPDVIVLDISMPEMNGLTATGEIHKFLPEAEILILTQHQSRALVHDILSAGAHGYVLKSDAGELLEDAIDALSRHTPFFTKYVSKSVIRGYLQSSGNKAADDELTLREREIVQLVAEGKSNKGVATILGISIKTAETHRAHILQKLDLHSTADLVLYAVRNQIITP